MGRLTVEIKVGLTVLLLQVHHMRKFELLESVLLLGGEAGGGEDTLVQR